MSIPVYNAHNSGAQTVASASLTVSITVVDASYLGLWAACFLADNTTMTATFNGAPVIQKRLGAYNASAGRIWEGFLVAPSVGTFNLVFTPGVNTRMAGGGIAFSNVHQIVPTSDDNEATGNSLTPSVTILSTTDKMIVAAGHGGFGWASLAMDSPGNTRWAISAGGPDLSGGGEKAGSAGSTAMSWTATSSGQAWVMAGLAINGYSPGPSFRRNNIRPRIFAPGNAR